MGFKDISINFVIVSVLFLSIISWIIITQTDNNTEFLITNNTLINESFGGITTILESSQPSSQTASQTFENITPSSALGFTNVVSIVAPVRIFKGLALGTYNILIVLPAEFLGVPDVVLAVINAVLILVLILGIWIVWQGGGN